jgi:hypothetical protein
MKISNSKEAIDAAVKVYADYWQSSRLDKTSPEGLHILLTAFAESARVEGPNYEAAKTAISERMKDGDDPYQVMVSYGGLGDILDALASPAQEDSESRTQENVCPECHTVHSLDEGCPDQPASIRDKLTQGAPGEGYQPSSGQELQSPVGIGTGMFEKPKARRMKASPKLGGQPCSTECLHIVEHDECLDTLRLSCEMHGCQPVEIAEPKLFDISDVVPATTYIRNIDKLRAELASYRQAHAEECYRCEGLEKELAQAREQLAEKDAEIERLNGCLREALGERNMHGQDATRLQQERDASIARAEKAEKGLVEERACHCKDSTAMNKAIKMVDAERKRNDLAEKRARSPRQVLSVYASSQWPKLANEILVADDALLAQGKEKT